MLKHCKATLEMFFFKKKKLIMIKFFVYMIYFLFQIKILILDMYFIFYFQVFQGILENYFQNSRFFRVLFINF